MGGGADAEFPVSLFMGVIIGIAFVVVNRFAGFCVGGKDTPVLPLVRQFFKQKKRTYDSEKDSGESQQVFSLFIEMKKRGALACIQIFSEPDHADHGEKHDKCLSPETEAVSREQQKSQVVF